MFDAKIRVLVRNFYQLLKMKVNQNGRITSGFNRSEDPMATLIAMDSFGVIYTAHCICFYSYKVWIFHCFKLSISHYVGFLYSSAYYLLGFLFITAFC